MYTAIELERDHLKPYIQLQLQVCYGIKESEFI